MQNNKSTIELIKEYCQNKPASYETRPFGIHPICYRVMGKIFAQFNPQENFYKITLKNEPEKSYFYRELYPNVIVRGYHCPATQQPYWNTIDLNDFSDMDLLFQMIDEAYDEVVKKFSKKQKARLIELSELEFKDTDGADSDFAMLCNKLDIALEEQRGKKEHRTQYNVYNQRDNIHDVIIAYQNGIAVACGAFKMYDEEHAELKRIFTDASHRNIGVGAEMIRRLESKAKIKGYKYCVLETGKSFQAACHMYQKAGYKIIPNYGPYVDMQDSICMERKI